jgi:hypothetical protein
MTTLAFVAVEQALARTAGEDLNSNIMPKLLLEHSLINSLVSKGDATVKLYGDHGAWSYTAPGNVIEEDRTIIFDLYMLDEAFDVLPLDAVLEPGLPYHVVCQWKLKGADRRGLHTFGETTDSVRRQIKIVDIRNHKRVMSAAAKLAIHEAYSDARSALKIMLDKTISASTSARYGDDL